MQRLTGLIFCIGLTALAAAARAEVVLYEHDNYGGRNHVTERTVADLAREGFNDRASSLVVRGGRWQLCSDAEFRGRCVTLDPGNYPSLSSMGLNDKVSSLRELGGRWGGGSGDDARSSRVMLFEHAEFRGRSHLAEHSVADLAREGFNDKASSIEVRGGRWQLCSDSQYRGNCITLGPGSYASLSAMGLNDKVSSLRELGRGGRDSREGDEDEAPPQVRMHRHGEGEGEGEGEVRFRDGCSVRYDEQGQRDRSSPECSREQLRRADRAMDSYRREQLR